ncbi:MAG TPA: neutral zinc metallopeptidase, partial [Polyangiaceae bacterium]
MRWDESHDSPDVVDRRGERGEGGGPGMSGLLGLLPFLLRTPYGWVVLLIAGGVYLFRGVLGGSSQPAPRTAAPTSGEHRAVGQTTTAEPRGEEQLKHFVAFVLDDVQTTWTGLLTSPPYRHAKLVLYSGATQTGCGYGQAATGPFYCPEDERAYIDLSFFHELEGRLGAAGDFAEAYVVAHELGHHVQKILGITA